MEQTLAENAAVEAGGDALSSRSNVGCSFGVLADAWARLGARVPIAIVGSIADDLLGDGALPIEGGALGFDDVTIDARGVAQASRSSVEAIAVFVVRALGEDPPAAALPVIARFSIEGGARDAEQLRAWIREAFGTIAPHDEVAAAVADARAASVPASTVEVSSDLPPATAETPLGIATAAIDFLPEERDQPTEIIRPRPLPSFPSSFSPARADAEAESEPPEIPILSAIPEPEPADPDPPAPPPVQQDSRPVIRHQLQKPSVRVHSAPAARRSAKPVADPRDSLRIPHDRPHWGAWLFVISLLVIGALFWLRYL